MLSYVLVSARIAIAVVTLSGCVTIHPPFRARIPSRNVARASLDEAVVKKGDPKPALTVPEERRELAVAP